MNPLLPLSRRLCVTDAASQAAARLHAASHQALVTFFLPTHHPPAGRSCLRCWSLFMGCGSDRHIRTRHSPSQSICEQGSSFTALL